MSVRLVGRRMYLGLAVVLTSAWLAGQRSTAVRLSAEQNISVRTLQRWRQWWNDQFPLTPQWQAACARFMPPPDITLLPACLLERFAGDTAVARCASWPDIDAVGQSGRPD